MKKMCFGMLTLLCALALTAADKATFVFDKAMPVYKCGEPAKVTITAFDQEQPVKDGKYTVVVSMDGNKVISTETVDFAKANPVTVSVTSKEPTFVLVRLKGADGKFVGHKNPRGWMVFDQAGAGFSPEKIQAGYDCPEDFMAFWEAGRKQLADQPVELKKADKFCNDVFTVYYVTVNTLNNEKVTGYLSIPNRKGPFPAYITVPGAGPGICGPNTQYGGRAITLSMNVHKFPTTDNSKDQKAAYDADRKASYYPHRGAGDRNTFFFYSAYIGIDRAINHVANMKEWDHKHMVIDGSSQGGASALILAGFNRNITALAANVPAMCDHGGYKLGRSAGWPNLNHVKNVNTDAYAPYFDAANFARFITVPALVSCGFIDTTCFPSSVYAAYNNLKGEKQMIHTPVEGHTVSKLYSPVCRTFVLKHLGAEK